MSQVTKEQQRADLPAFEPGDTLRVNVRVREGDKEHIQGRVRRAKLYYLRALRGKAARIREKSQQAT